MILRLSDPVKQQVVRNRVAVAERVVDVDARARPVVCDILYSGETYMSYGSIEPSLFWVYFIFPGVVYH